jgi:hypothetical protein
MTPVYAMFKNPYSDIMERAPVLNPGDNFGKGVFLLFVGCGFNGEFYVVEADNLGDAEDILAEHPKYGDSIAIGDVSRGDYGHRVENGDIVLKGRPLNDQEFWVDLNGNLTATELAEPSISGQGTYYDNENVMAFENPSGLRYYGQLGEDHLPHEGLTPEEYHAWRYVEYEVVVGNIGTVYAGRSYGLANATFDEYVVQSKSGYGRASGEAVTLFKDNDIHEEYEGANNDIS